jgi:pilus assembly protein TadC
MMLLLVELGSGSSVLAALQRTSDRLPEHRELRSVTRVATVAGLTQSISRSGPALRPVVAQLARAQRSGAPLAATVRRLLEHELAAERSKRIARARTLPVRLMIPVTLLMLPGVVLLLYAPSLMRTFDQLTGVWS